MAASDLPLGHDGPLAHVTMQATSMQQIGFSCLFNRVTYSKSNCVLSWRPFEPLVTVNTSCTIWTDYVACKLNEVRDECGCKMTQWLRDLFVALGGPIVRAYCGDYDDLLCQDNGHPYTSCSASCYVIMATVVLNVVARQLP
ncbi:hypothetical protein HDE_01297 [Halotydeus destructor]|nr:hypothetical protein HDE_01297 [Halotydeus destructor]